jgi:hypothetical protein
MAQVPTRTSGNSVADHTSDHNELAARHNEFEGAWPSYTPALQAATTNPTLGTGSLVSGKYTRIGRTITGWAKIKFGTSGAAAGSGSYRVTLPVTASVPANAPHMVCGHGYAWDASTNLIEELVPILPTGTSGSFLEFLKNGSWAVNDAAPWTWTNSDEISVQFMYEAAS